MWTQRQLAKWPKEDGSQEQGLRKGQSSNYLAPSVCNLRSRRKLCLDGVSLGLQLEKQLSKTPDVQVREKKKKKDQKCG